MNLSLNISAIGTYKNPSQRARIITEEWAEKNLYCPACSSNRLTRLPNNTESADFDCPSCSSQFQLKATQHKIQNKITDAGYGAMIRSLEEDRFPHLFIMHYSLSSNCVENLLLIPRHLISISAIEKRKPLALTARRAGWVGCNILFRHIPLEGRIPLISSRLAADAQVVRSHFQNTLPLSGLPPVKRGWALDVLTGLQSLKKKELKLNEIYSSLEKWLSDLHPENRHVRPKIRQQLQILRDLGYLVFTERGLYRIGERRK